MAKTFNARSMARIGAVVRQVESTPRSAASTPDQTRTASPPFVAIISGGDMNARFSWTGIVMQADGTWTTGAGSGTNNALPLTPTTPHYGARVLMWFSGYNSGGNPLFVFVSPGFYFPVKVQKDGGDNATGPTETADYTYTVRDISGTTVLGSEIVVVRPREYGPVEFQEGSAGYGVAFFDAAGNLKLWDAGEVYEITTECDDGA